MAKLSEIIKDKIRNEGPISFRDFMDMALYEDSLGYYSNNENKIGTEGDFYTAPVLSSLFGKLIGKQIEEMWAFLDKQPFTLVEYGAGTGVLSRDIINFLKYNKPLYSEMNYCIIEKSQSMKILQKKMLPDNVTWFNSIKELPPINGCILSNEVLDNFPVHKVTMKEKLSEVFVDYQDGFVEVLKLADEKLKNYFAEQNVDLPENYSTEINMQAIEWIEEIASNLKSGFVVTIDYGFSCEELYSPKRSSGTLVCYKCHEVNNSYYSNIGQQDITAHVNFSALKHWGEKYDLKCSGFTTQANFLRSLGLIQYLRILESECGYEKSIELIFQINKLLMGMGSKFKIFIQQKGITKRMLTGMQFAIPF